MNVPNAALSDLRIVEGSAFVAAPLGGLTLAQLGADVIRFDHLDGGLDFHRWPITNENQSLFWIGLNRGKCSIQVDLKSAKGREIVSDLITAPGKDAGIYLTNLPAKDELSYEALKKKRPDLIMVSLTGNYDGTSEVDYTVHPSFGYPLITGPLGSTVPVNSVLPTWDLILGNMVAIAILVAERKRRATGEGEFIKIALSDVALSVTGALGRLSQAHLGTEKFQSDGNFLYGAFGANFTTKDNYEVMIVGLTPRQWISIKNSLDIHDGLKKIEEKHGANLDIESDRYRHRRELAEVIRPIISETSLKDLSEVFAKFNVSWSKYQTFTELLKNDPRASEANPIFSLKNQDSIGELPNISSPIRFTNTNNLEAQSAPHFGANTEEVLKRILQMSQSDIQALKDSKLIK
jgi:2-methylfumaryl-CoA isomerase